MRTTGCGEVGEPWDVADGVDNRCSSEYEVIPVE
jgi:hypothetical protein